ncbi:MAG: low molecular weight phosphotyrosine protein phosphatase [Gemmatimonadetes bacterium]|nr:low molecular weight phosphotyrosine protein phosphatase [Gemmatimonadota bacterium]
MSESPPLDRPRSVLFVCLGNICRSPLAEGVFLHLARERGATARYRVDSAGTGAWHVGEPPDPRSAEVAQRHGLRLEGSARQVRSEDLKEFDLILAMDSENLRAMEHLGAGRTIAANIALLRDYDPNSDGDRDVPDPYYGGTDGFERVFHLIRRSCAALLNVLEERPSAGDTSDRRSS